MQNGHSPNGYAPNGHAPNGVAPLVLDDLEPVDRTQEPGRWNQFRRRASEVPVHPQRRAWWIVSAALGGLVLTMVIAGSVGLALNGTVRETTEGALRYDVALHDAADNFRLAILDVRHFQRNLVFNGPDNDRVVAFGDAHVRLLEAIETLEMLGVNDPSRPQPNELRMMAEAYYDGFAPAVSLYGTDRAAFDVASNNGIIALAELERDARRLDRYAEVQGEDALDRVEEASSNARLVLLLVLGGKVLIGAALVYAATRVFREVRRLYEAEQAASKRLGEALQAKSDFVADASHELRTPLTVLRGNAEAGLAIDSSCAHREYLEDIVEESVWMTRLVEDLLFLARSDAAAPPLKIEPVAAATMLEGVASRADVLVRQSGGALTTALAATGTVVGDGARIEQAILALVDNAAKFSPPGGRVRLSASNGSGELTIEVADQGPGIPEADLGKVFERFYRTDRARSRRRGGAGLGLSIARTIVEAHGGRIEARSRLGHGTQMRIHLPLAAGLAVLPAPPTGALSEIEMARTSD